MFFRVNGSLDEPRFRPKQAASTLLIQKNRAHLTVSVSLHSTPALIPEGSVICAPTSRNRWTARRAYRTRNSSSLTGEQSWVVIVGDEFSPKLVRAAHDLSRHVDVPLSKTRPGRYP